jgi:hypothetical protein
MSDGSPPQRPPQISPDGKWVWDGTEWQPVAGRDSGHTAVFPAFSSAAKLDPGMLMEPSAVPFQAPVAPVNYAASYSTPETSAPLWQVKPGHWNKYLYVVAGIVVLVMAGIFLSSLGPLSLPWFGGSPQTSTHSPAPSLLSKRSDSAVATNFLTDLLAPSMTSLNKVVAAQVLSCNGYLTIGCQSALTLTDDQLKSTISVVNSTTSPACIAPNLSKLRADLASTDSYVRTALQAYTDNSKRELGQGVIHLSAAYRAVQADFLGAQKAQSLYCDTQLAGP